MAHVADELEEDQRRARAAEHDSSGLPSGAHVPDIVHDKRALRVVPWHGDGPDPLGGDV